MSLGIATGTVFSKILCFPRGSRQEMFDKKRVLNNFTKKHLSLMIKLEVEDLNFIKKRFQHSSLFLCIFRNTF